MRARPVVILAILCCVAIIGTKRLSSSSNVSQNFLQSSPQVLNTSQVESLRDDLNKMRALVQQMETNLSFVDTTQTPLKHQFQLEIDMWKLTLQRMEKQLQGSR